MTRTAALRGLLTGIVLLASSVTHAYAQTPRPAELMDPKLGPKFADVAISAPSPQELASCTVEFVPGPVAKSGGWLLKDGKGQPIRGFFDTTGRVDGSGRTKVDTWKYYKDGVEVYREFDTAGKGIPNNFRWLNTGGMKWGVGAVEQGKGVITSWRMISAEEVGQEAFHAIARQDFARLQALFISDADMQLLKLPLNRVNAIRTTHGQAQQKFAAVCKAANLGNAKFDLVEGAIPECDTRGDIEVIRYSNRQIRFVRDGKYDFLSTHELIQVGMAWRLVDVPGGVTPITPAPDGELEKLLSKLADLDMKPPLPKPILAKDTAIEQYYRVRIPLVQQIIPQDKAEMRESWYKQLFDNILAMAQNSGDKATIGLLKQMAHDGAAKMPGSNLAAYGAYRCLWCDYSIAMAENPPPAKVKELQDKWHADLADFTKKYSKSEDTPEALHQLAIGCEFDGKLEEGKRWYKRLYEDFPNHHLAPRARGSEARLNLVGAEIRLVAPLLADPLKGFDIAQLKGKVVVVHYWGSYNEQYKDDFVRIQRMVSAAKDVVLVSINLDDTAEKARDAVTKAQAQGIHLFQATNNAAGLNSPLATQYGIHMLPTLFVVGPDGRVRNNNVQVGDLDTELKKVAVSN